MKYKKLTFTLAECATHVDKSKNPRKLAFTLAEVLIVIAIVGAVFVMVMANFIQKQQERVTVTKVQKAYNILNQAYLQAVEEYGVPSNWGIPLVSSVTNSSLARDILFKNLKVLAKCSNTTSHKNCGISSTYKRLYTKHGISDFKTEKASSVLISDGLSFEVFVNEARNSNRGNTPALEKTLGFVNVDINGYKKPNRLGYDYFLFYITDYGIIPIGTVEELKSKPDNVHIKCSSQDSYGRGCAAWVLKQKNMNYLHSTKCSFTNPSCK